MRCLPGHNKFLLLLIIGTAPLQMDQSHRYLFPCAQQTTRETRQTTTRPQPPSWPDRRSNHRSFTRPHPRRTVGSRGKLPGTPPRRRTMDNLATTEDPRRTTGNPSATEDPLRTINNQSATRDPRRTMDSQFATEDPGRRRSPCLFRSPSTSRQLS